MARARAGGAVRRTAAGVPRRFAYIRLARLDRRRLAVAFNQHAAPLAISEQTRPRRFGGPRLSSLLVAPNAAEFPLQLFAGPLRIMEAPRMRWRLSAGHFAIFLFVGPSLMRLVWPNLIPRDV
jgi:hypothetical protein